MRTVTPSRQSTIGELCRLVRLQPESGDASAQCTDLPPVPALPVAQLNVHSVDGQQLIAGLREGFGRDCSDRIRSLPRRRPDTRTLEFV
jgi:hypothetical protein